MNNNKKDFPVLYSNNKNKCCGCTACYAVCPVDAIFMAEDDEGFLYPKINEKKCIKCYSCINVCSFK